MRADLTRYRCDGKACDREQYALNIQGVHPTPNGWQHVIVRKRHTAHELWYCPDCTPRVLADLNAPSDDNDALERMATALRCSPPDPPEAPGGGDTPA